MWGDGKGQVRTQAEYSTNGSQSYSSCLPGGPGYKQITGHSIGSWREQNV